MNDDQIKHMTNRFLMWRLPENFSPDNGISFKPTFNDSPEAMKALGLTEAMKCNPVGTNLFDASQAEVMVRYIVEGLEATPTPSDRGRVIMASVKLGAWMSAALDDPAVCAEMKADIQEWFSAGEPVPGWGCATPTPSDPSGIVEGRAREAWRRARTSAFMLLQNSEGCAANHYGKDHEIFGLPGWLSDCREALESADAALSATTAPELEGWQDIATAPKEEEILLGYYGPDKNWYGYFWKGHLFQWDKMPEPLATGGSIRHEPTHWCRVSPPRKALAAQVSL